MDFHDGGEMHDGDFEGVCLWLVLELEVSWCGCVCLDAYHGGAQEKNDEYSDVSYVFHFFHLLDSYDMPDFTVFG